MALAESEQPSIPGTEQEQDSVLYPFAEIQNVATYHGLELSDVEASALFGMVNGRGTSDEQEIELRWQIVQSAWFKETASPHYTDRNFALRGVIRAVKGRARAD